MKKLITGSFEQRERRFFTAADGLPACAVTACAYDGDTLFAGTEEGLFVFDGERFSLFLSLKDAVGALYTVRDGSLWAGVGQEAVHLCGGKIVFRQSFAGTVVGFAQDEKRLWLLTPDELFRQEGDGFVRHQRVDMGGGRHIAAFGDGNVFVSNPVALLGLHGKRPRWGAVVPDTSGMPSNCVTALAADPWGHLWVGTDEGLALYDAQNAWFTHRQIFALPAQEITAFALGGDGSRYIGTNKGIILQRGTRSSHYGKGRWLPADEVTAIGVSPQNDALWVGTDAGLARISFVRMTLADKAAHFQHIAERYHEREGYFCSRSLPDFCRMETGHPSITDNDGLWTGSFLAAMALRYGATKDPDALAVAGRAMRALLRLYSVTGIPGFPARAYRRPGEHSFGDGNPEWHLTADEKGALEWKGETSSDETTGHFFGLAFYHDLCADETEKKEITAVLQATAEHILSHGGTLCDADGLPTTWAHWGPEELNRTDFWYWERGCNSMELLCMLRVVYAFTGEEKYFAEYKRLITREHYALNCTQHKMEDAHENHIDDNLGFLTAATLLRYEDDPYLRGLYLSALRHHWQYERVERCALWNFIYGAWSDGDCCDLDRAVQTLEELPLDFISYPIRNSDRPGLVWDKGQELFGGERQLKEPLPYDEKPVNNFDNNPFRPDGGNGHSAEEPTIFLLPYWYGIYYGLIE